MWGWTDIRHISGRDLPAHPTHVGIPSLGGFVSVPGLTGSRERWFLIAPKRGSNGCERPGHTRVTGRGSAAATALPLLFLCMRRGSLTFGLGFSPTLTPTLYGRGRPLPLGGVT